MVAYWHQTCLLLECQFLTFERVYHHVQETRQDQQRI